MTMTRHASPDRPAYSVGRMRLQQTRKMPGDYVWNSRSQAWEQIRHG